MQKHDSSKDAHLQNSIRAYARQPTILPILPIGFSEILIFVSLSPFEAENRVALLGQPHCRAGSPKARADDHKVIAVISRHDDKGLAISGQFSAFLARMPACVLLLQHRYEVFHISLFERNSRSRARMSSYS